MNILITGGLGFIGGHFLRKIKDDKAFNKIIVYDKMTYASNYNRLKSIFEKYNFKLVKGDITNKENLLAVFQKYKPNIIINFAAESHVDSSIQNPELFLDVNAKGTLNLLIEAKKLWINENNTLKSQFKNSVFYQISTDEVFGDILKGRASEKNSYRPSSPYAASKAASDHLVFSYIRTYKIPAIVTNCSNNYGPKQHPEKLIPKLIYNILNNKPLPIYGKGINSREWIYVKDHCEALFQVFKKGKIGETYNIGSNKNLSNLEVCKNILDVSKKLIKLGDKVKIYFIKDRPGHDMRYALDSKKIKKELKFKSRTNFKTGIKLTFEWYKNNKSYYKYLPKKDILRRLGKND